MDASSWFDVETRASTALVVGLIAACACTPEPELVGASNQACFENSTCNDGLFCDEDAICRVVPQGAFQGRCNDDGSCNDDLVCDAGEGRCVLPAREVQVTSFVTSQDQLNAGESATLSWTTEGADECFIDGELSPVAGSLEVSPTTGSQISLVCEGPGGTATRTLSFRVASLRAITPARFVAVAGDEVAFSVDAEDVSGCVFAGERVQSFASLAAVVEPGEQSFALACEGFRGVALTATTDIVVGVEVPVVETTENVAARGAQVAFSWTSVGADACEVEEQGVGPFGVFEPADSVSVTFDGPVTYRVICSATSSGDSVSVESEVSFFVRVQIEELRVRIVGRERPQIEWVADGALACSLDLAPVSLSTAELPPPDAEGLAVYSLACGGLPLGQGNADSAEVRVHWGDLNGEEFSDLEDGLMGVVGLVTIGGFEPVEDYTNADLQEVGGLADLNGTPRERDFGLTISQLAATTFEFASLRAVGSLGMVANTFSNSRFPKLEHVAGSFSVVANVQVGSITADVLETCGSLNISDNNDGFLIVDMPALRTATSLRVNRNNNGRTTVVVNALEAVDEGVDFSSNSSEFQSTTLSMNSLISAPEGVSFTNNFSSLVFLEVENLRDVSFLDYRSNNASSLGRVDLSSLETTTRIEFSSSTGLSRLELPALDRVDNLTIRNLDELEEVGAPFLRSATSIRVLDNPLLPCSQVLSLLNGLDTAPDVAEFSPNQGVCN